MEKSLNLSNLQQCCNNWKQAMFKQFVLTWHGWILIRQTKAGDKSSDWEAW